MKLELAEIYRDIYVEPSREACQLAFEYGYLPYIVQRYIDILGLEDAVRLIKSFEKPVRQTIRTNTVFVEPDELRSKLERTGFKLEKIPWSRESFWLVDKPQIPSIGATHEYLKGYYYLHRDATSLIPVYLLLHEYEGDVLDACAAPGGKATFMGQILVRHKGIVYANDLVFSRLKTLIGHVMRMKLNNFVVIWDDARRLPSRLSRKFDRILVDAPCSGEGRVSIDPGRKTRTSILDLALMVKREIEILHGILDLANPGGIVEYVTCSIAPEENEYVVNRILTHRDDIEIVEPPIKLLDYHSGLIKYRGIHFRPELEKCIRIWPHIHGLFGYFICLLRKKP